MKTRFLLLFAVLAVAMSALAQPEPAMDPEMARQDAEHRALIIEREKASKAEKMKAIQADHDQHLSVKTNLVPLHITEIPSGPEDTLHGPMYLCTDSTNGKTGVS